MRTTRHRQALTRNRARPGTSPARTGRRAAGKRRTALRPATPAARPPPGGAALPGPAKITVTIWHNVAFDGQGRHVAMLDGYQPGDPVVRVFAYQADPPGGRRRRSPKRRSPSSTTTPGTPPARTWPAPTTGAGCGRCRVGDVVAAGDVLLAVGRPAGWEPVTGPLTEVRTREHGTSPLPLPGRAPGSEPAPGPEEGGPR